MFREAPFIIAKIWNQPREPSDNKYIKKVWYKYIIECYSAINKNVIMLIAGK
jgi:hypothetical protein